MAAPEYVPSQPVRLLRAYASPPWRRRRWLAARPGDLEAPAPRGERLGTPAPDQGFALRLARRFEGGLALTEGEDERDALYGACLVALKRASLFGRAPLIHDLRVALGVWGFLADRDDLPSELVDLRRELFEGVRHPHHYEAQRRIADMVPDETLAMTPEEVAKAHRSSWRSLLRLDAAARG